MACDNIKNPGYIEFENPPYVSGYAAVGSKMEKEGPLGEKFDYIFDNPIADEKSWERAEIKLQKNALGIALKKAEKTPDDINFVFAGDLLNQCIGSTFGIKNFSIPFAGVYGACSTMALSMIMASVFISSKIAKNTAAVTSSHFCTAERQYRFPLEYGGQRPPTAQWTATASGCVILSDMDLKSKIKIKSAMIGTVKDLGVSDAKNMGAAMAPAAYSTISEFLKSTNTDISNYDKIFTGDLGQVGSDLLYEIFKRDGIDISSVHNDCGLLLYDRKNQDVHAGGSGCGCSASVLCTHIFENIKNGTYKNVLFCATGALLSATSTKQGETIPSVAHLVQIVGE